MGDWPTATFSTAPLEIIDGDRGGNYPSQSELKRHDHCLFLNASNVTPDGFRFENLAFISKERDGLLRKGKLQRYDIVLTTRGTVGNVGFFDDFVAHQHIRINSGMVILRGNAEKIVPRYLYLFVRSKVFSAQVAALITGSAQPQLPVRDIQKIRISLPQFSEQQTIASILGALDDKIELNRRMNETLEAMARAIFKDWFVDFGPTRAKAECRPPYLAPDLWSLFPARLDVEGKPEGWDFSTIGEEADVVGGSTPSTKESAFWDGDMNWCTPKDLSSLDSPVLFETERKITNKGLEKISSGLLPIGTVLLSSRAPIGYLALAEIPVAINQGFIAMKCNKRLSNVYVWLWTNGNMETILQKANGSTFQEVSKSNFRPIPVIVPPASVRKAFDSIVLSLYQRIVVNGLEARTLAQTRDLLLPKLMSGEIRVRDAEALVEAAE